MPEELQTTPRAKLVELEFDKERGAYKKEGGKSVDVQFNPQTLKVNYKNQTSGGDQQGSSGVQFVGKGSTSLSVDLLFDVTRPTGRGGESSPDDVRKVTKKVNAFMRDLKKEENGSGNDNKKEGQYIPPGVRFVWGTFLFEGVMNSMDETLEFFDPKGRPLRATVSISISQQEIQFKERDLGNGEQTGSGAEGGEGTGGGPEERPPGAENTSGTSVQEVAGRQGAQDRWKEIADQNDIENPRAIHNPNALQV